MIRLTATTFVVGLIAMLVWAGMTFALSGLVSKALAAGLSLGVAVLLLGGVLLTRLWRRRARQLDSLQVGTHDEPHGHFPNPAGVADGPPPNLLQGPTPPARHDAA
jgi:membrane protein implicated in regulation of membrane protease activity